MDHMVRNNAAAAQATAFDYAQKLPSMLIEDLETELKELRMQLLLESENEEYEDDFRAKI